MIRWEEAHVCVWFQWVWSWRCWSCVTPVQHHQSLLNACEARTGLAFMHLSLSGHLVQNLNTAVNWKQNKRRLNVFSWSNETSAQTQSPCSVIQEQMHQCSVQSSGRLLVLLRRFIQRERTFRHDGQDETFEKCPLSLRLHRTHLKWIHSSAGQRDSLFPEQSITSEYKNKYEVWASSSPQRRRRKPDGNVDSVCFSSLPSASGPVCFTHYH